MPLPLPGSPSFSWAMFRERFRAIFRGADPRVCTAFWLFGLINNVLYVIILSAALDLVGPSIPKGVILLADVIPSFATKLTSPYFIHLIPYRIRVLILVFLSAAGMLILAFSPPYVAGASIASKIMGIILASISAGAGELSFLGLTHYYGPFSLAAWGSGTGGAGLVGAGAYAIATTSFGFSVSGTLLVAACLPAVMLGSFFVILPGVEGLGKRSNEGHAVRRGRTAGDEEDDTNEDAGDDGDTETEGLLATDPVQSRIVSETPASFKKDDNSFAVNLERVKKLFFPYMLPLLLVYIAEYTINQGVAPTLLFPLPETPFQHFRAFYPTYNAIYQSGVFISRSSTPFFRIHNLYAPSFLQVANLVLLSVHALFPFLPNVYVIFVIIFWEGLLGGLVYVNTFAEIADRVPKADREFSLGATTVSDSAGICAAGFLGMVLEVGLCGWQVRHGRDYCRRT